MSARGRGRWCGSRWRIGRCPPAPPPARPGPCPQVAPAAAGPAARRAASAVSARSSRTAIAGGSGAAGTCPSSVVTSVSCCRVAAHCGHPDRWDPDPRALAAAQQPLRVQRERLGVHVPSHDWLSPAPSAGETRGSAGRFRAGAGSAAAGLAPLLDALAAPLAGLAPPVPRRCASTAAAGPARGRTGSSPCRGRCRGSPRCPRPGSRACPRGPAPPAVPGPAARRVQASRAASESTLESASADPAARASSVGSSTPLAAGRAARRRIRSRQALTTIRCSQVVTAESPRKSPARRNAEIIASCSASAASSGSPSVRSATAHSRSRWRVNNIPNAVALPAQCLRSRSRSDDAASGAIRAAASPGSGAAGTGEAGGGTAGIRRRRAGQAGHGSARSPQDDVVDEGLELVGWCPAAAAAW